MTTTPLWDYIGTLNVNLYVLSKTEGKEQEYICLSQQWITEMYRVVKMMDESDAITYVVNLENEVINAYDGFA